MKTGKDNQTLANVSIDPFTNRIPQISFWECSVKAGRKSYHLYNRMLLPNTDENDYFHLKSGVQLWDTGAERQVEVKGPDAHRLVQSSTPRDLSEMEMISALIPTVDQNGYMTNDPVSQKSPKTIIGYRCQMQI